MDISPKSTLKIRCTGNMQALFHSLEKSKLSFNAEHSELFLLNVPLHCHNFSAMVFYQFKIGFRCTIFRWLCILYYLPMKNMFCEIVVRLFIHQFLCVGFCSGFFFVLDFWFCLSIFFFFYFNFQGDMLLQVWLNIYVVGYFVVHNRMHKYPIELIVSILLHETDWCYIGRHPRNSSDD